MKDRPMLFSGAMVRAILGGQKTQTRRIMKPQPSAVWSPCHWGEVHKIKRDGSFAIKRGNPIVIGWGPCNSDGDEAYPSRYGQPGGRLWVREAWRADSAYDDLAPRDIPAGSPISYDADEEATGVVAFAWGKTRPSIHMPRWASRIALEIVSVRVERLQDISEADAKAEGVERTAHLTAKSLYTLLWDSINGAGSWECNPWVWVVEFKRVEKEEEAGK